MKTIIFIQWCLDHLNYWTITILMTIESSFIPFPSEIVIPPAAFKAAAGELDVFGVIFFSTFGACLGALINYVLARYLGRPIIYAFVESKWGKFFLLSKEKMEKAELYFDKNGNLSTLVGRLIPGIRQLISIPAGLARMKLFPFLLYTSIGAAIWNSILVLLGYYAPKLFGIQNRDELLAIISRYSHMIGYIFLLVVLLVLVAIYLRKKLLKK